MVDIDLQEFVNTFNSELQNFHSEWSSRVEAGAKRTSAQLWANGYLLRLDLTENHLEPGRPKYDEIRMVILRDSREPLDEATWSGGSPECLATRFWQSDKHGDQIRWGDERGTEATIEQVFSAVRAELDRIVTHGD